MEGFENRDTIETSSNFSKIYNPDKKINDANNEMEKIHNFFDLKKFETNNYDVSYLGKRMPSLQLNPQQEQILFRFCHSNKIQTDDQKIKLIQELVRRQYIMGKKDKDNNTRFNDALKYIEKGKKSSDIFLDAIDEGDDLKWITEIVYKHIDEGKDLDKGINFSGIFILDNDLNEKFNEGNNILSLDKISEILGDKSEEFLKNIGQRYREKIEKEINDAIINEGITADKLCDELYINYASLYNTYSQYVLFLSKYGKQFLPEKFWIDRNSLDRAEIKKRFNATLKTLGYKVSNVDQKALQEEEERQNRIELENRERIKVAQERIRKRNEINKGYRKSVENNEEIKQTKSNADNATGTELAYRLDLSGIEIKLNHEVNKEMIKYPAFEPAWKNFISSAGKVVINGEKIDVKSLISFNMWRKIYNIDTDTINEESLKHALYGIYKKVDGSPNITKEEIDKIQQKLLGFSSYFRDSIKNLSDKSGEMENRVQNTIKTYAMGSIIDNIRGIMAEAGQNDKDGFKLTQEPPVKIEGDYLILPGEMNGTKIDIHYNIKTGELFINSLITQIGQNKFVIGEKGNYKKVGELKSFNNIISEYYQLPGGDTNTIKKINHQSLSNNHFSSMTPEHKNESTDKPYLDKGQQRKRQIEKWKERKECFKDTLNQEINLIGEEIKKDFRNQELKNSIITRFMKTFNIIPNDREYDNIEIEKGCNLFDLFQILSKSDSGQLESFRTLTEKITKFAGLEPGKNVKYPHTSELYKNEYFSGPKKDIQDSMLVYAKEMIKPEDKKSIFKNDFKSSIIDTIMKYSISGEYPNQKIDTKKIEESLEAFNLRDDIHDIDNLDDLIKQF